RFSAPSGLSAVETEVVGDHPEAAATELVRRLLGAPTSEATALALLEAAPLARPRPLDLQVQPTGRGRRFYERPWLWAAVLATTAAVVATAVAVSGSSPSYQLHVDGSAFGGR